MRSGIEIARATLKSTARKKDFNEFLSSCDVCSMGIATWERDSPYYSHGKEKICSACYMGLL